MERPQFVNDEIYHIYSRGVEKRNIFTNDKDRFRFIHDLFEFNDTAPAANHGFRHRQLVKPSTKLSKSDFDSLKRSPRKLLTEILCFCLMPNHYHLMLRQRRDGGITEFMRKLGTGYTNYFNIKYRRVGSLFQGKFKAVRLQKQHHFLYLPQYIHLNPLDIVMPEWREKRLRNVRAALEFLQSYRWSSYLDYIGRSNFPSVTQRTFLLDAYGDPTSSEYRKRMEEWLAEFPMDFIQDVTFE